MPAAARPTGVLQPASQMHRLYAQRVYFPRVFAAACQKRARKDGFIGANCVFDTGWVSSYGFSVETNNAQHIPRRYGSAFFLAACTSGIPGIDHCVRIVGWMGCNTCGGFRRRIGDGTLTDTTTAIGGEQ